MSALEVVPQLEEIPGQLRSPADLVFDLREDARAYLGAPKPAAGAGAGLGQAECGVQGAGALGRRHGVRTGFLPRQ